MAFTPPIGSVVAFQSDPTKLVGTVSVVGVLPVTLSGNPSVSGAVTAPPGSIIAISGTVTANAGTVPGSVVAFQGTPEWTVKSSLVGGIFPISGSVAAVVTNFPTTQNISGSVAAWLQSTNASVITVFQSSSLITRVTGSVVTLGVAGSVTAVRINDLYQEETVGGPSVRGIAIVWESNANTSVMSTVSPTNPLRVLGSISGAVTAPPGSVMNTVSPAGSITQISGAVIGVGGSIMSVTNPAGSVTAVLATQVTSPWIVSPNNSSLFSLQPAGSVLSVTPNISSIIAVPVGSVISVPQGVSTSSVYAVLSSITSVSIMAANSVRKGATIYNNSGTPVFVKLGTAATTSVYTVQMFSNEYYEVPFNYTGVVAGITASNAGIINVTELT